MHGVDDKHMWLRIAHDNEIKAVHEKLFCWVVDGRNWSLKEEKMLMASVACLDDIVRLFPETTEYGKKVQTRAYFFIYFHYGFNLFNSKNYIKARECFVNALKRNPLNLKAILYYLCTYLPVFLIDIIRKIKRGWGWTLSRLIK